MPTHTSYLSMRIYFEKGTCDGDHLRRDVEHPHFLSLLERRTMTQTLQYS